MTEIAIAPPLLRPVLTLVDSTGCGSTGQVVPSATRGPHGPLTVRECEVLALLADGLSTRDVARRMAYSERTIKNVLQDVTLRLHLRNRTHAVAVAVRNRWI